MYRKCSDHDGICAEHFMHTCRVMDVMINIVAPVTQPRALSIIQGRAVGVAHYLLGGIAQIWSAATIVPILMSGYLP